MSTYRNLAIVVSRASESGDLRRALALAEAARSAEIEVGMFFMDRAVKGLPAFRGQLDALAEDGVELCACASSVASHGLIEADVGMWLGSQDDHAALVRRADRVLAFT